MTPRTSVARGFDPKCYDLAVHFGLSTERLRKELAQHIQDSIEDWLNSERDRLEKKVLES